jgi:hypothetical protein
MSSEPLADLWITCEQARTGTTKRFLFEGKTVHVRIPPVVENGNLVRLTGFKRRALPFLRPKDAFVKIHIYETDLHPIDRNPYSDDDLNILVECVARNLQVLEQIEPDPLFDAFEDRSSVEKLAESIFSHMKRCTFMAADLSPPPVKFESMDSPGQLVRMRKGGSEYFWIEISRLYRYHTCALATILAHESMHFISQRTALGASFKLPEIRVGASFKERPTMEVLVDIASILAGAANLYQRAISVWPGGMRRIFGYVDQNAIAKTKAIAQQILLSGDLHALEQKRLQRSKRLFEREFGPDFDPRRMGPERLVCRRCGGRLAESNLGYWFCEKCGAKLDIV